MFAKDNSSDVRIGTNRGNIAITDPPKSSPSLRHRSQASPSPAPSVATFDSLSSRIDSLFQF